jgi:hypothetical protein
VGPCLAIAKKRQHQIKHPDGFGGIGLIHDRRPAAPPGGPLPPRHKAGLLAKYAAQVGQANKGAP